MGNPIKKVTLKALEAVRIRVDGEKQNFEAGDLIEVAENVSGYYLRNGF
jgi:acid stress-induced BolA-like protein IbaG/YrbA